MKSLLGISLLFTLYVSLVLSHSAKSESAIEAQPTDPQPESESGGLTNILVGYGLVIFGALLSTFGALTLYVDPILKKLNLVNAQFKISEYEPFLAFTLAYSGGVLLVTIFLNLIVEGYENFTTSNLFPAKFNVKLLASCYFIFWMGTIMAVKAFFRSRSHRKYNGPSKEGNNDIGKNIPEYESSLETKNVVYDKVERIDTQTTLNLEEGCNCSNESATTVTVNTDPNSTTEVSNPNVGYEIAIAIAIHNFPEGVITFLAAYQSLKGGILFGIALALHKFPEGLMIGIPIVLATKSKFRAVMITFCASFFTQILGATTAYLVSKFFWNDIIAALLFLLAAALMTVTLFDGIFPLAKAKDSKGKYFVPGVVMGISSFLILNSVLEG